VQVHCWTYYTLETPPLFAVFAHGMAALAFWRSGLLVMQLVEHALPATHVLRMLSARLSARGTTGGLDNERAGEG
jgi:hypothetical protein